MEIGWGNEIIAWGVWRVSGIFLPPDDNSFAQDHGKGLSPDQAKPSPSGSTGAWFRLPKESPNSTLGNIGTMQTANEVNSPRKPRGIISALIEFAETVNISLESLGRTIPVFELRKYFPPSTSTLAPVYRFRDKTFRVILATICSSAETCELYQKIYGHFDLVGCPVV